MKKMLIVSTLVVLASSSPSHSLPKYGAQNIMLRRLLREHLAKALNRTAMELYQKSSSTNTATITATVTASGDIIKTV